MYIILRVLKQEQCGKCREHIIWSVLKRLSQAKKSAVSCMILKVNDNTPGGSHTHEGLMGPLKREGDIGMSFSTSRASWIQAYSCK
jgi:hypothetical protein